MYYGLPTRRKLTSISGECCKVSAIYSLYIIIYLYLKYLIWGGKFILYLIIIYFKNAFIFICEGNFCNKKQNKPPVLKAGFSHRRLYVVNFVFLTYN